MNADGSGLSRSDRVTCALLVDVLQRAGPDGLLVRDLPVAGRSGTLVDQLKGTVAAGRVHAKTGTLDGVKALSGWALAAAGQGAAQPGAGRSRGVRHRAQRRWRPSSEPVGRHRPGSPTGSPWTWPSTQGAGLDQVRARLT